MINEWMEVKTKTIVLLQRLNSCCIEAASRWKKATGNQEVPAFYFLEKETKLGVLNWYEYGAILNILGGWNNKLSDVREDVPWQRTRSFYRRFMKQWEISDEEIIGKILAEWDKE